MRDRVEFLERQMSSMIALVNRLETTVERLGFDVRFLQAWAKEMKPSEASESTISDVGIGRYGKKSDNDCRASQGQTEHIC